MQAEQKTTFNVLLWGFGNMSKVIARYLLDNGDRIVGAIGHHGIGEDIGRVANLGKDVGVTITAEDDAESVLGRGGIDACIVATRSTMKDLQRVLSVLGGRGINAITIGEEAFFSTNTSKAITAELDALFKANNAALSGTGYQDVYWAYLVAVLAGSSHRIDRIEGYSQYNVDDYGMALCEAHGVGFSAEKFAAEITNNENAAPAYGWNCNEWLCAYYGWTAERTTQQLLPVLADKATASRTLGRDVAQGESLGMKSVVVTTTKEGPVIESHICGKVYAEGDQDTCHWEVKGEPLTVCTIARPATVELTCASVVNRLPDLVASAPGYVTTDKWGPPRYRAKKVRW